MLFPCPRAWWSFNKPSGCAIGLANDSTKPSGHGKSRKARLSRLYSYNHKFAMRNSSWSSWLFCSYDLVRLDLIVPFLHTGYNFCFFAGHWWSSAKCPKYPHAKHYFFCWSPIVPGIFLSVLTAFTLAGFISISLTLWFTASYAHALCNVECRLRLEIKIIFF